MMAVPIPALTEPSQTVSAKSEPTKSEPPVIELRGISKHYQMAGEIGRASCRERV